MSHDWEVRIREAVCQEVESAGISEERQQEILTAIQKRTTERSNMMRIGKKKFVVLAVAALVAAGSITAIAAGRVAGLRSATNRHDAVRSSVELTEQSAGHLGSKIQIPQRFGDTEVYREGYLREVEAMDDAGNRIGAYPELSASYGTAKGLSLSVSRPGSLYEAEPATADEKKEIYNGIELKASEDHYLFLPPDAKPSQEDSKLADEGKLMISYGSQEEEREVFKYVSWINGDLHYLLHSYGDYSLDEMVEKARTVIDANTQ